MTLKHSFDLGEIVTIFQMHPSKGLLIEGRAAIVEKEDVDEYYLVRFRDSDDPGPYQRFVDVAGQDDPTAYIREFNKKIGYSK
jgi:hypothetical protein